MQDKNRVCLTVAIVRYVTLGRQRTGVATTYLQDRFQINESIPAFISHNPEFRLPQSRAPVIMIGPGTGIAPFIAFIQERGKNAEYVDRTVVQQGLRNYSQSWCV